MQATAEPVSDQALEALFADVMIHVMPTFAAGVADVEDCKTFLCNVMDDQDIGFRVATRDEGIDLLRRLARLSPDLAIAADLLARNPRSALLVLGWHMI